MGVLMLWGGPSIRLLTVMVTSSLLRNCESSAVKRKMYVPGELNRTVVFSNAGSVNRTAVGPETNDQLVFRTLLAGIPSSVAVPFKVAVLAGQMIVWSGPALTTGGSFTLSTVTRILA